MIDEELPDIEYSPLGGRVTDESGEAVQVSIYRVVGSTEGWALEVTDSEDGATVWEELFPTDQEALDEFHSVVKAAGLASFREAPATEIDIEIDGKPH